jgi:hypothetical protein
VEEANRQLSARDFVPVQQNCVPVHE